MTHSLDAYFTAVAGASGALVGLLFVAASIARDEMFGERASVYGRARASLALTSLVTPLLLSLLGLIPGVGIGVPSLVVGVLGIVFVVGAARTTIASGERHRWRHSLFLVGFAVVSVGQVVIGVTLQVDPGNALARTLFAVSLAVLIGIGIDRAWELTGGSARSTVRSIAQVLRGTDEKPPEA